MTNFIEGECRSQATLLPDRLDDYVTEENPIRVIDIFVDELDLGLLGFKTVPEATGRPAYDPATLLKIYVYGYLNRVQSSRRLEREAQRNVELMWLTGRLAPDFKTIADFRRMSGQAIQKVCREFVLICRKLDLFADAFVAIDGSKFKAVNNRDRNFTQAKMKRRLQEVDESIARYLTPSGVRPHDPREQSALDIPGAGRAAYSTLSRNGVLTINVLGNEGWDTSRSTSIGILFSLTLRLKPAASLEDMPELAGLAKLVFERWGGMKPLQVN